MAVPFFFFEPHILTTSRPHTRLGYSWLQGVSKFTAFYIVVPVSLQNLYKQLFESNPCNCMQACELCCVPLTVSIRCYFFRFMLAGASQLRLRLRCVNMIWPIVIGVSSRRSELPCVCWCVVINTLILELDLPRAYIKWQRATLMHMSMLTSWIWRLK